MKIESAFGNELRANPDPMQKFAVIVSFADSSGVDILRRLGIEPTVVYQSIAAAAAELTAAQIETLAAEPAVTAIERDQPAQALRQP